MCPKNYLENLYEAYNSLVADHRFSLPYLGDLCGYNDVDLCILS
jgi:hypothetical protein